MFEYAVENHYWYNLVALPSIRSEIRCAFSRTDRGCAAPRFWTSYRSGPWWERSASIYADRGAV
eukprot:1450586-Rhodomonas_salina.4